MKNTKPIYADWAAAAPLCPAAAEELRRWLADPVPANPSSVHSYGMDAADRLAEARARLLQAAGWEGDAAFVSGGTEGLALAVYSLVRHSLAVGRHRVILSPLEHPAVTEAVKAFALPAGMTVETCAVSRSGVVDPADFRTRLGTDVGFCCVMAVQNETGVCQPVEALTAAAHGCGALFLTDAVQAAGHIPLPSGADVMVISGHKFGAMPGVGAVFHRVPLVPLQKGGGQEHGFRGGTENLPGICSMAAAASVWGEPVWMASLRDRLEADFCRRMAAAGIPVRVSGAEACRIGSVSHFVFPDGPLGETLVLACDLAGLCCSAGAACHSAVPAPSSALLAMGYSETEAVSAVRLSFGSGTTAAEMEEACRILGDTAERLYLPQAE